MIKHVQLNSAIILQMVNLKQFVLDVSVGNFWQQPLPGQVEEKSGLRLHRIRGFRRCTLVR